MLARLAGGFLLAALVLGASGAASGAEAPQTCSADDLAFALPRPSAPHQTQAIGLTAANIGAEECRLALPLTLTLQPRFDEPLRVAPQVSRLRLDAPRLRPRGRASVIWTYANYCGRHDSHERPLVHVVRVRGIELRGRGGTAPCHSTERPISLTVLFACPSATGPAIDAILPRPLALCPR